MPLIRTCSAVVIRCFKRVEHFADWLTGAAGPVFVALCWGLIILGGVAFFEVVGRQLSWAETLLLLPILVVIPINLYGQYYLVTHVPPGFPSPRALALSPYPLTTSAETRWIVPDSSSPWSPERWGLRKKGRGIAGLGLGIEVAQQSAMAEVQQSGRKVRRCRKCDGPKPERTHHCSVCKRCILMMDHHCPWINSCVGLYNQRHFVLFMAYLCAGCTAVAFIGYQHFWSSIGFSDPWPAYTPRVAYTLVYVLCLAIGPAVGILGSWHMYMVAKGETSIESHDNAYLESRARPEGLVYLNPYDLGRRRNIEQFFNVGPDGYSRWSLLFPLLVPPASNGWTWPHRALPSQPIGKLHVELHSPELAAGIVPRDTPPRNGQQWKGLDGKQYVLGGDEQLTDDEEGGGGFME